MKKYVNFSTILLFFYLSSCSSNSSDVNDNSNSTSNGLSSNTEWLVPVGEIRDGGPGRDGIPSIDHPQFVNAADTPINFLNDNDLIIGLVNGSIIRAYPHFIMDWHEIVNDNIINTTASISYCPLTGTAFAWKSNASVSNTEFGVSGLLYKSNLILYDRETDSNWSQLRLECINGSQIGDEPELLNIVETNWGTWRTMYPNTQVLTTNTGYNRNYGEYPYGSYRTDNNFFLFNVSPLNPNLPSKERVFAIIDGNKSKVYGFTSFQNGNVIKDTFNGKTFLITGNENIVNAFELTGSVENLDYHYTYNNSEGFFNDSENNNWSVFGKARSGPRTNWQLIPAKNVVSYWFAIAAFYPNPEIYQN